MNSFFVLNLFHILNFQPEEKMEMKSPGADVKYGVEQGYSENYGKQAETTLMTTNGSAEYTQQSMQPPQQNFDPSAAAGAPVNPFTQQQYQKSATNPFQR